MPVLSRPSVLRLIDQGQLVIDPFQPDRLAPDGSYTFTLSDRCQWPVDKLAVSTETASGVFHQTRIGLNEFGNFIGTLHPNAFALLYTHERLKTPSRIVGWLSTHPRLAKLGLDLLQSSFLVPPGCDQPLVLETSNRGPFMVRLVPGSPAVKIVFLRTD